ncbi:MAG TPA: tetratricopeptide repeat protein [Balneolaceae bacterium]
MSDLLEKHELEAKVNRYINGELSADEVDELWADLIQDEDHLDYLKNIANLKAVIKQRKEKEKSRRQWYYAAAAVIALVIAVMTFMNYFVPDGLGKVEPISQIKLNSYRSVNDIAPASGDSEIIKKAVMLANTGKVLEAINLLQGELEKASEPKWIAKLSLSLGSLYYNQGDYPKAIEYYSKVIANKEHIDVLMLEKAYWYRGNAYFQNDQLTKARENIEKAYNLNGAYRRVTESYLKAMS